MTAAVWSLNHMSGWHCPLTAVQYIFVEVVQVCYISLHDKIKGSHRACPGLYSQLEMAWLLIMHFSVSSSWLISIRTKYTLQFSALKCLPFCSSFRVQLQVLHPHKTKCKNTNVHIQINCTERDDKKIVNWTTIRISWAFPTLNFIMNNISAIIIPKNLKSATFCRIYCPLLYYEHDIKSGHVTQMYKQFFYIYF